MSMAKEAAAKLREAQDRPERGLTNPLQASSPSFLGAPKVSSVDDLETPFAAMGAPFGVPYGMTNVHNGASEAPAAVRHASNRYGAMQDRYDFDLGGAPFNGQPHPVGDLGDVFSDPYSLNENSFRVSEVVAEILRQKRKPIVLGGDDSTTWMTIRGYEQAEPITVVQFDAHIDFRDEVDGVREGWSSPMRRASESSWVEKIIHVGARGLGSGRVADYGDTRAAGNAVVTPRMIRKAGADAVLDHVSPGSRVHIAFDMDGLDPSVAPGTSAPLPGGIDFIEAQDVISSLAMYRDIVGWNVAELYPSLDVNNITSLVITRLIATWIGIDLRKSAA